MSRRSNDAKAFKNSDTMQIIIETKTNQAKNPNTKTTYLNEDITKSLLTPKQYNLITNDNTLRWTRRLGGSETARRSYTAYGYNITKLTSKSPNGYNKIIREFKFLGFNTYKEDEVFNSMFKEYKDGLFYLKRFKSGKTFKEVQTIIKDKLINRSNLN